MTQTIRYFSHDDIDKTKWDQCIQESSNGIVFAYSWFLDSVFDGWDALVLNEYEAVFPITKKTRFGLSYLANPIFALQLGLFSKNEITKDLLDEFLKSIPKKIKLIDITINFGNTSENQSFDVTPRKCQFIDMASSYEEISNKYSTNLKRNIKKGIKHKLKIISSEKTESVVQLFKENRGESLTEMTDQHYTRLRFLLGELMKRKIGKVYECWHENVLIASACFSICNNRIVYIKGGSNSKGRELGAMHLIMDEVIRLNANSTLIFDFGGSSIKPVARFNHGFGATDYEYQRLYRNNLPFFVKLLKKF